MFSALVKPSTATKSLGGGKARIESRVVTFGIRPTASTP